MAKNGGQQKGESQKTMLVEVSFPSLVQIELVQANELRHYEIFLWFGSAFLSAAIGFWTAFATATPKSSILLWVGFVFSFFTALFVGTAIYYRLKLRNGSIKKSASMDQFD